MDLVDVANRAGQVYLILTVTMPAAMSSLAAWLDENPNLVVDLAARIAELGRQPVTARNFLVKYTDRVLFGADGPRVAERVGVLAAFGDGGRVFSLCGAGVSGCRRLRGRSPVRRGQEISAQKVGVNSFLQAWQGVGKIVHY